MINKILTCVFCFGLTMVAGCGKDSIDLSCDKPALYQQAVQGKKVVAPEGLDDLDPAKEMPVPDAAPLSPRSPGDPCLDIPPRYLQEDDVVAAPESEK